jgi:hypothetical protein
MQLKINENSAIFKRSINIKKDGEVIVNPLSSKERGKSLSNSTNL